MILFMLRKTTDLFALAKQKIWKSGDETASGPPGGDLSPHSLLCVGKCLHLLHECSELGPPGQIPDPSLTQPMETSVGAQPPF